MKNFKNILVFVLTMIASSLYAQQWKDVTPEGYKRGIYSFSFINSNEGWLCARDNTQTNPAMLLHTSNACLDWDTCFTFPGGMNFNRIQMIDSLNGYGAGGYGLSIFWRTTDGGHTWQDITDLILMQNGGPLDQSGAFFFISADTGFYGGLNSLYKTVDAGLSWSLIEIPADAQPSTPEINEYRINEIYFSDPTCGWATGNGLYSCVLKTTDSGQSWQLAYSSYGTSQYFANLNFTDCNRGGIIVTTSYAPYIILTSDNFDTVYYHSFDLLPTTLSALCFQNDTTVWIGGVQDGVILRSLDGGINFDTLNPVGFENQDFLIYGIIYFGNSGYAIGSHVFKYLDTLNTSVSEIPKAVDNFYMYPNPTDKNITIEITADNPETVQLVMYSTAGVCVQSATEKLKPGENYIVFSVKDLTNGIYYLNIRGKSTAKMVKVIVVH